MVQFCPHAKITKAANEGGKDSKFESAFSHAVSGFGVAVLRMFILVVRRPAYFLAPSLHSAVAEHGDS